MIKKIYAAALAALGFSTLQVAAQAECDGVRYKENVFDSLVVTSDVTYGNNINQSGSAQSLELDVYEPAGDAVTLRPALVWIHGGSFISGDKAGPDVKGLCEEFAHRGYVSVSIEYRLGMNIFGPDSVDGTEAVMRAVHDARAAVRYLYKDVKDNGNTYGIDTNRIIIAGVSAGAITAVHYGYLEDISEWPSWVDSTKAGLGGGVEGESGNAGYSSRVIGVVNVAGALARKEWLTPGSLPIVGLHGDADDVVPYGSAVIMMLGIYPIMMVHGSSVIHTEALSKGVNSCFYTYKGAGHVPHVGNAAYTDTTVNVIKHYIYSWVCGGTPVCGYQVVGVEDAFAGNNLELYPNPASQSAFLRFAGEVPADCRVTLLDLSGKTLLKVSGDGRQQMEIPLEGIAPGLYMLQVASGESRATMRLVVN